MSETNEKVVRLNVKDYGTKGVAEAIISHFGLQLFKPELQSNDIYVYDKTRLCYVPVTRITNFGGYIVRGIDMLINQLLKDAVECEDSERKNMLINNINKMKSSSFLRGCKEWFYGLLESSTKLMPVQTNADMNFGGFMYRFSHDEKYPIELIGPVTEYGKLVTTACVHGYDAVKEAKVWNEKMKDLIPDDNERAYFQAMMGSALTGHEKRMLVMHTQKNCGKSTIARTINKVLSDYAGSGGANMFCKSSESDHSAASLSGMELLIKQRITIIDEVSNDFRWNVNFIKQVTGGTPIAHKKMFKDLQSTVVHTTPVIWTNHMPIDYTFDDAIKGRIHFLPRFQTVDQSKIYTGINGQVIKSAEELEDYLVEYEAEAIIAWFFEGWRMYVRGQFMVPQQCLEIKEEIEADSRDNVVTAWMSEHGFSVVETEQSIRNGCSLMAITNFVSSFGRAYGYKSTSPTTIKQMLSDAGASIRLKCKNKNITNLVFTNDDGKVTPITKENIKLLKELYSTVKIDAITVDMIDKYLNGTVVHIGDM